MKRAKDYVHDDGPGRSTVTSLAYWLTPEGLNNPIVAALLRDALDSSTGDEFAEAFDGATKVEAAEFLAAYELCVMPFWGADELAQAIHGADSGRDEAQAKRSVSLAQKAGELPEVFQPRVGVEWAMRRGYLFGAHADFLGLARGSYRHPHAPLAAAPAVLESVASHRRDADDAVLSLHDVAARLLDRQNRFKTGTTPIAAEGLWQRVLAAAGQGRLRVRHPDTLLPECFGDWPPPSSGELVCTVDDVDAWLTAEGVPYRLREVSPEALTQSTLHQERDAQPASVPRVPLMQANVERVRRALVASGFDPADLPPNPRGIACPAKTAARKGAGLQAAAFEHAWKALPKQRRPTRP